jgi:hypothetical protein
MGAGGDSRPCVCAHREYTSDPGDPELAQLLSGDHRSRELKLPVTRSVTTNQPTGRWGRTTIRHIGRHFLGCGLGRTVSGGSRTIRSTAAESIGEDSRASVPYRFGQGLGRGDGDRTAGCPGPKGVAIARVDEGEVESNEKDAARV